MKIVFFGDSVTQAERNLSDPADLGEGYVKFAANKFRLLYPEAEIEILNRGVNAERTADLLARAEKDVVKENPDVIVLEVGINDVLSKFYGSEVSEADFEKNYKKLVSVLNKTGAKLILLQPFSLPIGDKTRIRARLDAFNGIIKKIADEEKLALIPIDEIFRGRTIDTNPSEFSSDGIHPTHRGHRYFADLVVKELKKEME